MESMDITYSIPRVNGKVRKCLALTASFQNCLKNILYWTQFMGYFTFFYAWWQSSWLEFYIMRFYWNSTNFILIIQGSFGPFFNVTKINCYKTLQSYTTEGFSRPSWEVFAEIHIWIKGESKEFWKATRP